MSYLVVSIKLSVNYDNESYNDENYNKKENTINTYTKKGFKEEYTKSICDMSPLLYTNNLDIFHMFCWRVTYTYCKVCCFTLI